MPYFTLYLHSVPVIVGIALIALGLDSGSPPARKWTIVTGIVLLVLGLIFK